MFDYASALNEVRVELHGGMERRETPLFDLDCLDEAGLKGAGAEKTGSGGLNDSNAGPCVSENCLPVPLTHAMSHPHSVRQVRLFLSIVLRQFYHKVTVR